MIILLAVVSLFYFKLNTPMESFKENATLRTICESWDCNEPIPSELSKICSTISECIYRCENIGAKMLRCLT